MNKIFGVIIVAGIFVACSNSAGYKETTPTITPAPNVPVPTSTTADTSKKLPPAITVQNPPPTQTQTTTKANTALNPAHGQPGHRCDIPEGSPLNSPQVKNATIPANPATNVTTVPVSQPQPPAKSNVKLNPAHGLPGHDCSIGVGQPLKN